VATAAIAVAFANWGIISGLAPLLQKELGLSVTQANMMIAVPVLLGSVGRICWWLGWIFSADCFGNLQKFSW
jgi:nitrate/nitrite transporter NarK